MNLAAAALRDTLVRIGSELPIRGSAVGRRPARRAFSSLFALAIALTLAAPTAIAQGYPSKPVRIITPTTAGSPVDVMARLFVPQLASQLGQPVVVENRPGGGGTIGMRAVAQAEPDGHTLLLHSVSFATAAAAFSNPGYDPVKSFVPIGSLGDGSWILVIPPTIPAHSVKEFVAYSKQNPGTLNFGFGMATAPHILGEAFKVATGADLTSVPYKGGADAIKDMLGGRIHMNLGTPATLLPLIRAGRLKPIAVTTTARNPDLPDVPTMAESGVPELTATFWTGLFAPAGTPREAIDILHRGIAASLKQEELQVGLKRVDFTPNPSRSPEDFAKFVQAELARWAEWTRIAGIKVR